MTEISTALQAGEGDSVADLREEVKSIVDAGCSRSPDGRSPVPRSGSYIVAYVWSIMQHVALLPWSWLAHVSKLCLGTVFSLAIVKRGGKCY